MLQIWVNILAANQKAHNGCVSSTICSHEVLSGLISVVSTVASASYNYILLPVAGAAASAGKAIYTYVLVPCGTATMACGRFLVQAGQVERSLPWEVEIMQLKCRSMNQET